MTLYDQGYRTYVRDGSSLYIRKPDGTKYVLSPYNQTCSCPAGARGLRCKHLKGLLDLVWGSIAELESCGRPTPARNLINFWFDYTDWDYQQRRRDDADYDPYTRRLLHMGYDPRKWKTRS